jgi:alpha-1,6-mannosyltransferase
LKICDVTKFYAETSGGVKTYVRRKADYMTRVLGWEHVLIVPGPEDGLRDDGPRRTYAVRGPLIPAHRPYRFLLSPRRVRDILEAEAPDLIEIGSPYFVPWVVLSSLPRRRPRLTGFYHADFPTTYVRGYARPLGERAAGIAEAAAWAYARAVYARCDMVLAASAGVVDRLRRNGIERVRHVPLGVDPGLFRPDRRTAEERARLGAGDGRILVLYAGRLSYEKGVATLLEGFGRLPPERYRLVVAGDGPERPSVEAFVAARPNAAYLGYCADPERLADLFAACDVFVAPGRHETFGLTVLEAFASGLPVVGTRGGAVAELIGEGAGAVFEPDDPASLADGIERLCDGDPGAMGARARALVEARYSWEKTFEAIAGLYRELVHSR